ncbi:hypothetical protein FDECE_13246 [Fusarium decemcellulare]|nr:hypothetical protein FDECE_13246 [Fusarium decemcellulare]
MPSTLRARRKPGASPLPVNVSATRREFLREKIKNGWTRPSRSSPRAMTPSEQSKDEDSEPAMMQLKLLERIVYHTPSDEIMTVNLRSREIPSLDPPSPDKPEKQQSAKTLGLETVRNDLGTQTSGNLTEPPSDAQAEPPDDLAPEHIFAFIVFILILWMMRRTEECRED